MSPEAVFFGCAVTRHCNLEGARDGGAAACSIAPAFAARQLWPHAVVYRPVPSCEDPQPAAQRIKSTGTLQRASTPVATDPRITLPSAEWPWEPITIRSNFSALANAAMASAAGPG